LLLPDASGTAAGPAGLLDPLDTGVPAAGDSLDSAEV
jgi:hypothetical protein